MSPVVDADVISAANAVGTVVVPGAVTPTEVGSALRAGAPAVKLFPAATVGTAHLAALRQVFPQARFVPTGGIGLDDLDRWRSAGAYAVGVGGVLEDARRRGGPSAARELSEQLTQWWVDGNTRPLGDG
jgi:2-dehydro-3-deoxyphosphogluconate aldolase/(4S)-4-hydroxy-2-oxoglutarate aldolase